MLPAYWLSLLFNSSIALRLTVELLLCSSFFMTSKKTEAGKRRLTWKRKVVFMMKIIDNTTTQVQGSNLIFELNSQMASTCSGFTSHKRVSTSLGTSVQHKIKKMSKILAKVLTARYEGRG